VEKKQEQLGHGGKIGKLEMEVEGRIWVDVKV
jgi:hypothetical protein